MAESYTTLKQKLSAYEAAFDRDPQNVLFKIVDFYEDVHNTTYHDLCDSVSLWVDAYASDELLRYIESKERNLYKPLIAVVKNKLSRS